MSLSKKSRPIWKRMLAVTLAAMMVGVYADAAKKRKEIKPGFNLFSKEQDIQLGQEASAQIEQEVEVVKNAQLTKYISDLGNKLAKNAQDPDYPFTFKVVADENINAFALPGGPIYMHTGTIAQADNEAQVAGVLAHEIGHVVLRHSTNQASKASLFQLPAVLAGSALGKSGGLLGALGQVGLSLGLNSALLKYSRNAEHDADIVGARMLAATGYSPVEMANFFQKLVEQSGGGGMPQFLASHPNPGNRVEYVTEEISDYRLSTEYITNTKEFPPMRSRAAAIKPTKQPGTAAAGQQQAEVVSGPVQAEGVQFQPPSGWKLLRHPDGKGGTIIPENGAVGQGIARGVIADYYTEGGTNQSSAVTKLIDDLKAKNPGMEMMSGQRKSMKFGGQNGESVFFQGKSPVEGQKEYVWMVAAMRPQGLFHLLMISPQSEYNDYSKTFENVVRSIEFNDKFKAPETQTQAPAPAPGASPSQPSAPEIVSGTLHSQGYSFDPPQGWRASRASDGSSVTVVPENGVVGQGIARGVLAGFFNAGTSNQSDAVTKLINDLKSKNPGLDVMANQRRAMRFGGVTGESIFLQGQSPVQGQKEYIWMVAAQTSRGLFHLLMISPESEYNGLSKTFEDIVRSIELE